MAIFKSVINVNNGNTGWTRSHVLDALETAFSQLGFNGGSSISGSPVAFEAPGNNATNLGNENWRFCGGPAVTSSTNINRYFYVTNNGTSSYNVLEQWFTNTVSIANDTLTYTRHTLQTGNPVVWNPDSVSGSITPLVNNTTYYVIKVDGNTIKLADTLDDATNGIAINITASSNSSSIPLRRAFNVLYNNYQIDVEMGDILNFTVNDTTSGGNFFLVNNPTTGYNTNKILNTSNYQSLSWQRFPSGQGTSNVSWEVRGWPQTEDEAYNPDEISGTGFLGVYSYGYINSANPSMRGIIRVLPSSNDNNYNTNFPYWKYTIPASGGRSSLKIRVYRFPIGYSYPRRIAGITIHSIGSGWGTNETLTIPGSAIGGVDITNDILVGVNSATTAQQNAGDGVCDVVTTNYGSGSTMYQKSSFGHFAVLKCVNDNTKTFGTTFYGFGLSSDNYTMYLNSGPMWSTLNRAGTNANYFNGQYNYGYFAGDRGLDYQEAVNYIPTVLGQTSYFYALNYATSSTPTAYPLSIRIYKAQSPQDINFAVIQFTQTINNAIVPFATFTIHKGSNFGANVWNLNHVWNGGITQYGMGTRSIDMTYAVPVYNYYSDGQAEPANQSSLAREANYGYLRQTDNSWSWMFPVTRYVANIDTVNSNTEILTYYRNSTYDKVRSGDTTQSYANRDNRIVSSSANYYKPIKGIPISNNLMPCPYYIPDDFIMLQVSTSPGLTQFRPGDTITVSPSEIYEIILAGYQTSRNGLDNIDNNSSIGMIFAARTT